MRLLFREHMEEKFFLRSHTPTHTPKPLGPVPVRGSASARDYFLNEQKDRIPFRARCAMNFPAPVAITHRHNEWPRTRTE